MVDPQVKLSYNPLSPLAISLNNLPDLPLFYPTNTPHISYEYFLHLLFNIPISHSYPIITFERIVVAAYIFWRMSRGDKSAGYNLRVREHKSIFECYNVEESDLQHNDEEDLGWTRKRLREKKKPHWQEDDYEYNVEDSGNDDEDIFDSQEIVDRLPADGGELMELLTAVKGKLKHYRQQFLREQQQLKVKRSYVGEQSVPICADVTNFNFDLLIKKQLEISQSLFDVIMMDPPWKLSTSQPSRGVAIQYDSLSDEYIEQIPVGKLQKTGVLLVWAINAKYAFTVKLMEQWGYRLVDSITWVKKTVNGKIAKGHGYYLQHAKETCLIGVKGDPPKMKHGVARDVIFSDRRGQSQKPEEVYEYIEELVPNGYYLEIFGRRNNLRDRWVTIGNEI